MKRRVIGLLMVLIGFLAACTPYHTKGTAAGGAQGGATGTILDHKNPWRGGVIGATLGAIAGATLADISYRGSRETVSSGRPVEYYTENGRGRYYAEPMEYNASTKCRKVHERVWEDGRLIRDHVREVCEGTRYERRY
jgi:hypothetical protein